MQMSEVTETDRSDRRFFLAAIDVESDCPLYEIGFAVSNVDMLIGLIGEDLTDIRCTLDLRQPQR
jgi:hypothetical protein